MRATQLRNRGVAKRTKLVVENTSAAIERAKEVLGSREAALRWLGTPVAALDYATPISFLGTKKGFDRVNDILTQVEHGVW